MKKPILLLLLLLCSRLALGWGQKGHDVVAYIAECHLTPQAAASIDKVLDGHSLVYYANWLDNASHMDEYAYSRTWHYLNIDEGLTLETMDRLPEGDILTALDSLTRRLGKGGLTHEQEALDLKMLIHLMGDLHCPMHTGRRNDLGGNLRPVRVFGRDTNLHSAWDGAIPEAAHKWSYTEWQQQIDRMSEDEIAAIQAGTPPEWLAESHEICKTIYALTPEGMDISYDYVDRATPVIERQFLRGGYRLARLLNEIYR